MEINTKQLVEYYLEEENITRASKRLAKEQGVEYSDNFRRKCSRILHNQDVDLDNVTVTETNQYDNISILSALKEDGTIMNIQEYCIYYNIPYEQVKTYKLVTHTGKGAYYNIASHPLQGDGFKIFYDNLLEEIANLPNRPQTLVNLRSLTSIEDGHLLVVDPCDIHIGKLCDAFEVGEEYNNQIAVERVKQGVKGIIEKSKGFNIEKILFIGGNDILHIDTPRRTTTSGTPQDTEGMWYSNFLIAKTLYIDILNMLLEIADVHFVYNPSNHDYQSGFFLADVIKTYYRDCANITFDCDISHRKYYVYNQNLIGTTHGDGAKITDLPLLMASESKYWSECKHRYIYGHHVHHKISKDYIGVTFEALRSPSGTDSWHSRNGYTGVPKAIEGFVHHPEFGQVARLTHIF